MTEPFPERFDIILALNVLHRVADLGLACANIFQAADEFVLEVGEGQLEEILRYAKNRQLRLKKMTRSHRASQVVGQRILLKLTAQDGKKYLCDEPSEE